MGTGLCQAGPGNPGGNSSLTIRCVARTATLTSLAHSILGYGGSRFTETPPDRFLWYEDAVVASTYTGTRSPGDPLGIESTCIPGVLGGVVEIGHRSFLFDFSGSYRFRLHRFSFLALAGIVETARRLHLAHSHHLSRIGG